MVAAPTGTGKTVVAEFGVFRAARKGYISTPSYAQVIEKVNTRAVGRWLAYRNHFSPAALARLAPWIEAFGYPPVGA